MQVHVERHVTLLRPSTTAGEQSLLVAALQLWVSTCFTTAVACQCDLQCSTKAYPLKLSFYALPASSRPMTLKLSAVHQGQLHVLSEAAAKTNSQTYQPVQCDLTRAKLES